MITNPLRFAVLAVALLALGTALSAQGRGPGYGPGRGEGRGFNGMNLTEAQRTQMKAIHDKHQAALQTKLEAAQAARTSLRAAMVNAATDAKTLQALHEKVSAAQFEVMLEHRAVRQEILPLLTAEQKVQFEKRPMGMGPGGGRGMGRGMGGQMGRGMGPGSGMRPDCPMGNPS